MQSSSPLLRQKSMSLFSYGSLRSGDKTITRDAPACWPCTVTVLVPSLGISSRIGTSYERCLFHTFVERKDHGSSMTTEEPQVKSPLPLTLAAGFLSVCLHLALGSAGLAIPDEQLDWAYRLLGNKRQITLTVDSTR